MRGRRGRDTLRERCRTFLLFNPCLVLAAILAAAIGLFGRPQRPGVDLDLGRTVDIRAWISNWPEVLEDHLYFELHPISLTQGGRRVDYPARLGVYLYSTDTRRGMLFEPPLEYGEVLRLRTFLVEPSYFAIPGVPDFREELWRRSGVLHHIHLKSSLQVRRLGGVRGNRLLGWLLRYRERFRAYCARTLSRPARKILFSSFLGEKKILENEDRKQLRKLGIFHLFVVSGFHVSLVILAFHYLFRALGVAGRGLTLLGMWAYVLMAGAGLSSVRAGVMTTLFYLLLTAGLSRQFLNCVGITALVQLVFCPISLHSPGFQFSYLSLCAIGCFVLPLQEWNRSLGRGCRYFRTVRIGVEGGRRAVLERFVRFFLEEKLEFFPPVATARMVRGLGWAGERAGGLLLASGFIQLLTLPVTLYYSNILAWTQGLSNLLLLPLFSAFVPLCLLLFVTFWLPFSEPLAVVVGVFAGGLMGALRTLASFSPTTYFPQPVWIELGGYFSLFSLLFLVLRGGFKALAFLVPALFLVVVRLPDQSPSERLVLTMLDVGQGESIHIRYPNGQHGLVDTGGLRSATGSRSGWVGERLLGRYLWHRRVPGLAYVLLSHPHLDHIQGYAFLKQAFSTGVVYFHDFRDTYRGPPLRRLGRGDRFAIGEVQHRVLHPDAQDIGHTRWRTNDASLVVLLVYRKFSVLLTGDIEMAAEQSLLSSLSPVTVLKAAHHGGRGSNSARFLARLRPAVALISAGRRNPFGHPASVTLKRFESAGIPVLITSKLGSIRVESDGREWEALHFSIEEKRFKRVQGSNLPPAP
ncbi:MAG: ComEC/Rec2 family competence protein [Acidobacteriota bacterium]